MSQGIQWSRSLSPYLINNINSLWLFHSPSDQDVLSSPQWTRGGPSLANEAHLVSVRHPGSSFPVHHPPEAVPKLTNDNLFPSLHWSNPFWGTYKWGSSWWPYNPMCASVNNLCAMMSNAKGICIWLIRRIHRLVYFWFLYFDLFYFYLKVLQFII